jgi:SAM-dependent methyltransferase
MTVKSFLSSIPVLKKCKYILKNFLYSFKKPRYPDEFRYSYQRENINHQFLPGESVLDIGSGGDPFPFATVLADRYLSQTEHRAIDFRSNGKPTVICDIHHLPFGEKVFDFVVSCHVLEHIDDPIRACEEIQRVGKAGFIETPRLMKDVLFNWADFIHHRWYLEKINKNLVFFEYDQPLKNGINSPAWWDMIFGPVYHPMQDVFNEHQNIFNVLFEWVDSFEVFVFKQDGEVLLSTVGQYKIRSNQLDPAHLKISRGENKNIIS